MKEVILIIGPEDGPISVVMAGVHGNEQCGLRAFAKVLPNLKIDRGKVYFILGNINALAQNIRLIEFDLNRAFGGRSYSVEEQTTYEYKRSRFLRQYLDEASALLDIHSSPTDKSPAFVICEPNGLEIVKCLPVSLVVHGFDATNSGSTDYYMNQTGKIGICIECGQHDDPNAEKIAEGAIWSFLSTRGHNPKNAPSMGLQRQRRLQVDSLYHLKTNQFTFARPWKDFEMVGKGTLIATDGDEQLTASKNLFIVFARDDAKQKGDEAFYLGHEV